MGLAVFGVADVSDDITVNLSPKSVEPAVRRTRKLVLTNEHVCFFDGLRSANNWLQENT